MIDYEISKRYASALFDLTGKQGVAERIDADLLRIRELLLKHPEISHLVLNSTISRTEKEDFIEKVFSSEISRLSVNFLKVLMKKKRFREIHLIQEAYHRLFEKKQGIQEVRVVTAVPLSAPNKEKLRSVLEKKLKSKVRLEPEVNPAIIGGMIMQFGGQEINASFKERLSDLRQKLMS